MFLLGLDFETQSADPKTTNPTEVGACLYNYWDDMEEGADWRKEYGLSSLIYEPEYPPQPEKIVELTGITDDMLRERGQPTKDVFGRLLFPLIEKADIIFCHKVGFDRTVLEATSKRHGLVPPTGDKKFICTLSNFPWKTLGSRKLSHLALEHNMFEKLTPEGTLRFKHSELHRAENDVDLMMATILENYCLDEVIAHSEIPFVYLRAWTIEPWKDGGVQTGIARENGFNWEMVKYFEDQKFPKMWVTRVKANEVSQIQEKIAASASPFRVSTIEGLQ